jgi:7-keto-8-aminopelargonate synthetase-like enzyme
MTSEPLVNRTRRAASHPSSITAPLPALPDIHSPSGDSFAPAHMVELINRSATEAEAAGVILQNADGPAYVGRRVNLNGRSLLNVGSCSYLGLELRPELRQGVIDAVSRYGTQFPFSRVYLACPLYAELESLLGRITGGHVLVAANTTLAHQAALPVLVEPGDAVIVDQFAHASLHTAIALLKGVHIEPIRHNRIDLLTRRIAYLSERHQRVWYVLDGCYSMLGDFAPYAVLAGLLEANPKFRLYIDDAHSTSWMGRNGHGSALDAFADTSRVVVVLSLNKAFSAAGAALVFADGEQRSRVARCGGPMLFSGPIQPPMLGAAVASAKLHLEPTFAGLQRDLRTRIDLVLSLAENLEVPLVSLDRTPIFFVRFGRSELAFSVVQSLRASGVFVCPSAFPAVPHNQSGIRFTASLHNSLDDIRRVMGLLARETKQHQIRRTTGRKESKQPGALYFEGSLGSIARPSKTGDGVGRRRPAPSR